MKNLIKFITLSLIPIFMTACPDKKSSNNNDNNGTVCVNCNVGTTSQVSLVSNMTSNIAQGALSLSLSADPSQMNYLVSFGQNPIFAYQGQTLATGALNLNYDLVFGSCRLPRGQYQITTPTHQPGTYGLGVFQIPQVQISQIAGPVSMTATIVEGVILTDGLGNIRGIGAVLVGITGYPAIQWGPMNGQVPCGDGFGVRF